jgi:uncharacterized damage-inducible protein DinB
VKEQLGRLLRYDMWANRETLDSLRPPPTQAQSLAWMGHIVAAEFLWLARLRGEAPPLPVWPDLTLEQCAGRLDQLERAWPTYLGTISESDLGAGVEYTNSKGERWTSTREEIMTHVVIHSAYHRGQIASNLRAAGHEPAYTDFAHAARQRFI